MGIVSQVRMQIRRIPNPDLLKLQDIVSEEVVRRESTKDTHKFNN